MKESDLQVMVADYLRLHYPDVLFHSDFGSGIKLTMGQAAKQKRQNGGRRAWPDMFIAEPKIPTSLARMGLSVRLINGGVFENEVPEDAWFGLFLELKREGTRLKKKNGEWSTPHIAEQAVVLKRLRNCGYWAEFACGFDEAKKIIDAYLGDKNKRRMGCIGTEDMPQRQ